MERCLHCDRPLAREPDSLCSDCDTHADEPLPEPPAQAPRVDPPAEAESDGRSEGGCGCVVWVFALLAGVGALLSDQADRTDDESLAGVSIALMLPWVLLKWGILLAGVLLGLAVLFRRKAKR